MVFHSSSSMVLTRSKSKVRKRWQLFHATDFQSLMYPCFTFCLVLGLFPYKINASTITASKVGYITSTIIICLFLGYVLVIFYQTDIAEIIKYQNMPETLKGNSYLILGTTMAIVTYILSAPRMRLLQTLLELSSRLPPESYQKLSILIHAKDISGFFLLIGQIPNVYSQHIYLSLAKITAIYIILLVFQMDMLYMNCVCVLKACFKRINDNLKNLKELIVNDEPHLLRRIYHEQRNPFLVIELKALKKRHLMISDAVQLLNTTFSLQLVATIVLTFAEITFALYFYIQQWRGFSTINLEQQIWYAYFAMSIPYYAIKMTLIVWACETGKDQALEIGTSIHEVLINTTDRQIKDEVANF